MARKIYIGFKGRNNASCLLVRSLPGSRYLLTNSFAVLRRDMEVLDDSYDCAIMFGIDKGLKDAVRIEKAAEYKGITLLSVLDLESLSGRFSAEGLTNHLSDKPTHYLCNEAYWHALRKFSGRAVLIHIPTIKNMDDVFIERIKRALD